MEWEALAVLVAGVIAGVAAIGVPALAFRFALRQDQQRFAREQRAACYLDLLTAAHVYNTFIRARVNDASATPPAALTDREHLRAMMLVYATEQIRHSFNNITSLALKAAASDATTTRAELDNLSWQATTQTANLGDPGRRRVCASERGACPSHR